MGVILDFYLSLLLPTFAFFTIYILTILPTFYWFKRKIHNFKPRADDLAFYYTYDVLDKINSYKTNSCDAVGKVFRKQARIQAESLVSVIDKNWTIGDFELADEMFEPYLSALFYGLKEAVKILKTGEYNDIVEAENFLNQFANFLLEPTFESFKNVAGASNLNYKRTEKKFLERWLPFFYEHTIIKHFSIVITIISLGVIPAWITLQIGGSIDTSIIVFVGIFGPAIGAYLNRIFKKA